MSAKEGRALGGLVPGEGAGSPDGFSSQQCKQQWDFKCRTVAGIQQPSTTLSSHEGQRLEGGDNGKLLFNGYRALVLQMKRVTGMDGDDGYTMLMYLISLNYIYT